MILQSSQERNNRISAKASSRAFRKQIYLGFMMLMLCMVFSVFFAATHAFPICSDDFSYSFVCGSANKRVENIYDIISSQLNHYVTWGGRFWAHCVVQFMRMHEKIVFDIANVIVYGLSSYFLAKLGRKSNFAERWVLIAMCLWCIVPIPGSTTFWLTGSINYLWSACINSIFLYALYKGRTIPLAIGLPLSILAGNAHESIAIGIATVILILSLLKRRKKGVYLIITAGYIIGALFNILAPGNYVRLASMNEIDASVALVAKSYLGIKSLINQFKSPGDFSIHLSLIAYIVSSLLFARLVFVNRKKALIAGSFLVGAIACISLNVCTGAIYPRALYGFVFLSLLSAYIAISISFRKGIRKYLRIFALVAILVLNVIEIPKAYHAITSMRNMLTYVRTQSAIGNQVLLQPEYFTNAEERYLESYGTGNNTIYNRPLVYFYGGKEYAVLNQDEFTLFQQNRDILKKTKPNELVKLKDDYLLIKLDSTPRALNLYAQPKEQPYKIKAVREYVKKVPRKIYPSIFVHDNAYFVLWKSDERNFSLRFRTKSKETKTINALE